MQTRPSSNAVITIIVIGLVALFVLFLFSKSIKNSFSQQGSLEKVYK